MKLSELIAILQKAEAKFGDMPVGTYCAEYCYELAKADDMTGIAVRILTDYSNASAEDLPGIDPTGYTQESDLSKFLTIFYINN